MSCDAIAFSTMLWMASMGGGDAAPSAVPAVTAPAVPSSVASEPLFIDIVKRAGDLRTEVETYRKAPAGALPGFDAFKTQLGELSDLDMKGHVLLAERGTDGDLKCILKGISQDLPKRLADIEAAKDPKTRDAALREIGYLLRDNVEVITTPAKVTS